MERTIEQIPKQDMKYKYIEYTITDSDSNIKNVMSFYSLYFTIKSNSGVEYVYYDNIGYRFWESNNKRVFLWDSKFFLEITIECKSEDDCNWIMEQLNLRGRDKDVQELRIIALEQKLEVLTQLLTQKGL